jgi:Tfp pilus assembly protein PilV
MIEVLIALFLTMIGIMALISMQPQGWLLSGRSDYLGRAAELLHEQLEINELNIMNQCNANAPWGAALPLSGGDSINNNAQVRQSGMAASQSGDVTFTVNTTITCIDTAPFTWRVTVNVTWPGNAVGIRESLIVTRQEYFRQGC